MSKKIDPYSPAWQAKANLLARSYAPQIYPCGKCNNPVASGYICTYCNATNPQTTEEEDAAWNKKYGITK